MPRLDHSSNRLVYTLTLLEVPQFLRGYEQSLLSAGGSNDGQAAHMADRVAGDDLDRGANGRECGEPRRLTFRWLIETVVADFVEEGVGLLRTRELGGGRLV